MTKYAQTVTGRVPGAALGATLMHEHIFCDLRSAIGKIAKCPPITIENRFEVDYFQNQNQLNMFLDDDSVAIAEVRRFREAGGSTIVELTTGGLSPQPERLAAVSRSAGVPIILGAGYYVDAYLDDAIRTASVEMLQATIVAQLRSGAWNTSIRAGLIGEIGCSWPLAPCERKILAAAAGAQRETGAAMTIHPGRHPDAPAEIADVLEENGGNLERTVVGHMDRTIFDSRRLIDLLQRGLVLEWDFFGIETSQYWMKGADCDLPTDYMRLDLIRDLAAKGFRTQVVISHDICTRTRLSAFGGHGYAHINLHMVPMMKRRGWSESDIEQVLVQTPARLLAYLSEPDARLEKRASA